MSYPAFQKVGKKLLPPALLQHSTEAANTRNKQFQILLEQRKWPDEPWDDTTIEIFLNEVATMDTNNYMTKPSGVGEREGRVYASLVSRRAYGLSHGVGRSGDLAESQPKAAGSSLLAALTNDLLLDFLQSNISRDVKEACLFPMATGMTMTLVLLTLAKLKPGAKRVIWLRHDQKSVFKSILTAGLTPIIIDPILEDDQLVTNVAAVESAIKDTGRENILCVISTTSCFAPRAYDNLKSLRKFRLGSRVQHDTCESTKCSRHFGGSEDTCGPEVIYNVVNNAYGMQSKLILNEMRKGLHHIDLFIQSTDKNLLVPVGGCILASPIGGGSSSKNSQSLLTLVRKNYPGRASSYPASDVLITVLSMGKRGFQDLLKKREENYQYLKERMTQVASKHGERVLNMTGNDISIGFSLKTVEMEAAGEPDALTGIGGMLFKRNITGSRVVSSTDEKIIDGYLFKGRNMK